AGGNQEFFSLERMDEIGKLASTDRDAFGTVVNYVTGSVTDHATIDAATDILMDIEKTIEPGLSDDMAYDRVSLYKDLKKD
ncbi:MAG: hypothetical protein K2O99_12360, partial [Lachnospiraceae bacterium]|nr:hypothetical protein [Lachnospiraceae bacterium]